MALGILSPAGNDEQGSGLLTFSSSFNLVYPFFSVLFNLLYSCRNGNSSLISLKVPFEKKKQKQKTFKCVTLVSTVAVTVYPALQVFGSEILQLFQTESRIFLSTSPYLARLGMHHNQQEEVGMALAVF